MSEQMDFNDGKYTVIYDNGRLKALCYDQPWRDLTGDNLVYAMLVKASQLQAERDALAAKLKELEGQEPVATYMGHRLTPEGTDEFWGVSKNRLAINAPLFARPVPAEQPVNARLLEALKTVTAHLISAHSLLERGGKKAAASDKVFSIMLSDYTKSIEEGRAALAAAEARQAEPVRLTRESVARAIWGVRREYEDRCDMELEDMQDIHPVWREADAVLAVTELAQSKPALMTIEQARDSERYAYLRSQHEGSVAASFAVFAPEQPIGEFGPVGSMPGELDAAIDAAIRANGYKVEG